MANQPTSAGNKPSRKQLIVIACLLAFGAVAGALILRSGPTQKAGGENAEESHTEEGHKEEGHEEAGHEEAGHKEAGHKEEGHKEETHKEEASKKTASAEQGHKEEPAQGDKVALTDAQIAAANIKLDTSGPATVRTALQFPGEIRFDEDRTAHIVPRAAGVVESVSANLGQQVKRGQVLGVISSATVSETRSELQGAQRRRELAKTTYEREKTLWEQKISPQQDVLQAQQALREAEISVANATQKLLTLGASTGSASLGRLELRAPFDGIVFEKHLALGESVKEDATVFTISALSKVWAEMNIPARELSQVRVGERVVVRAGASDATAEGTISYVGSLLGEQTRTARARVVLPNPQGAWRPGLFVTVEVMSKEAGTPVAVTVASSALQTVEGKTAVYLKVDGGFMSQPVTVGRNDGQRAEILNGLKPGASYATSGSFVIKSEQGKSSATHTH